MIKSLIDVPPTSHFSIQNLPFGICSFPESSLTAPRVCSIIGETVVDLVAVAENGLFKDASIDYKPMFQSDTLNKFISLGQVHWKYVRSQLQAILSSDSSALSSEVASKILKPAAKARMHLPLHIGDYTDFYSSKEHAVNVGTMFRGKENALNPNWLHIPIGYHGRASSIILSGTDIPRPNGQLKSPESDLPTFGPSKKMDFELEMAFVVGTGNKLGDSVSIADAESHIFGVVIMNDWSARDIQAWEYVPLGPFLGKNFATSISPWIVTMDALEAFRCSGPIQDPKPLTYLAAAKPSHFNVTLEVYLQPAGHDKEYRLTVSNLKNLYWSFAQQLAHHTVNGCNMQTGDLCGTGTISGSAKDSFGSMLELSWNGKEPIEVGPGITRSFLEDGDRIRMTAYCQGDDFRVGFGECTGSIIKSKN